MSDIKGTPGAPREFERLVSPRGNRLLAALPAADFELLRPMLALVEIRLGDVLFESGSRLRWFHFPVSGVVSVVSPTSDGGSAELAAVGADGFLGVPVLLGAGGVVPRRLAVHIPGHAYRIESELLLREFRHRGALKDLLLRYVQVRMAEVSQIAVCNRHHALAQRFCRRLLQVLDRVGSADIPVTQELISEALGVRRSSVAEVSAQLEAAGAIERRRAHLRVLDHAKIEERACECYAVMKNERDRLLPAVASRAVVQDRQQKRVD